jgi:hypothetical protein
MTGFRKALNSWLPGCVLATALAGVVYGQAISGSLAGSVQDSSGAVVAGATVKIVNEESGQERAGVTEANGDFVLPGLVPGQYTIRVEATGFRPLERKGAVVLTGQRLVVGTLQLEVGNVTEAISVTATGVGVQTETTNTSALLDSRQVAMQGLRGRDPISMLRLLPGVEQGRISDMLGGSFGTEVPRFMGKTNNTTYVDGVNGGDGGGGGNFSGAVNVEAIGEISVQMANYSAEHGRSGGPQINIITKSGGQDYHGTAYWFKRHEMFNANNFFNNLNGLQKAQVRFSNQGGTLGGPVPIKLGGEKKLFFFYSYDDTRTKRENPIRRFRMPTALEKQGNFSQSVAVNGSQIAITDPDTGAPFPNRIIPASRRDANGAAILSLFPDANTDFPGYNYIVQFPTQHPRRQHLFKVDYRPTSNDTISFKGSTWYVHQEGFESPGSNTGDARWGLIEAVYDFTTDMATASYTKIISPNLVNEFMLGGFYSTEQGPPVDDAALTRLQRQTRGLAGLPQFAPGNNPLRIIPQAQFSGLQNNSFLPARVNFDGRFPLDGYDTAITGSNNITYTRGAHTFKAGVWWEKGAFRQARSGNFSGEFQYQHNANNPRSSGYAFANAYLGLFNSYTESLGRVADNRVQHTVAWFAQDTWKVNRKLTLNLGLRMYRWGRNLQQGGEASIFSLERFDPRWGGNPPVLFRPVTTPQGRRAQNPLTGAILPINYLATIVPGTGYSCTGQLSIKSPCLFNGVVVQENNDFVEGGRGFIEPIPILFDPRIGIAYDPFGKGKTAIRASWGSYHIATGGADYRNGGPAYRFDQQVLFGDIQTMLNATPVTNPANVSGTYRDRKQELNYQYTFGIQQDIGWNTVMDVSYVGNTSRHRSLTWNHNQLAQGVRFVPSSADPTAPTTPLSDNFLRPFVGFGNIDQQGNGGTDRYDSLQVQVNRRFTGGVEVAGAYTYANGFTKGWYQQLPFENLDRNTDVQTHILVISYVLDLPRGSKLVPGRVGRAILDNWQASGVNTFSSGKPMDVTLGTTDGFDFSGGGESCGVVQTGPAILPRGERSFNRWFDTSVFRRPSARGEIGNNCQNYKFRGPGINNWDLSFFKNFPIGETKKFQLRWEMYNILNHTQFEGVDNSPNFNPQGVQTDTQFGRITSARQERRMQVALRFNF